MNEIEMIAKKFSEKINCPFPMTTDMLEEEWRQIFTCQCFMISCLHKFGQQHLLNIQNEFDSLKIMPQQILMLNFLSQIIWLISCLNTQNWVLCENLYTCYNDNIKALFVNNNFKTLKSGKMIKNWGQKCQVDNKTNHKNNKWDG